MLWGRKCGIKLHVETGEKMDSWKGQQLFQNFCPGLGTGRVSDD